MGIQLKDLGIIFKVYIETSIVDKVGNAIYVVFIFMLIEYHFEWRVLIGHSLYFQITIDAYKSARDADAARNIQRNYGVVVDKILFTNGQVSLIAQI